MGLFQSECLINKRKVRRTSATTGLKMCLAPTWGPYDQSRSSNNPRRVKPLPVPSFGPPPLTFVGLFEAWEPAFHHRKGRHEGARTIKTWNCRVPSLNLPRRVNPPGRKVHFFHSPGRLLLPSLGSLRPGPRATARNGPTWSCPL